ncbi:hypothetical protein WJ511_22945, partial [Ralstonia solanacearum]
IARSSRLLPPSSALDSWMTCVSDSKYVCTGSSGKIVWGGGGLEGRSEFGPNKSDFMAALYLDEQGNLIVEDRIQVHMSLRLLHIPTGTAQHYTVYRFRRLK